MVLLKWMGGGTLYSGFLHEPAQDYNTGRLFIYCLWYVARPALVLAGSSESKEHTRRRERTTGKSRKVIDTVFQRWLMLISYSLHWYLLCLLL